MNGENTAELRDNQPGEKKRGRGIIATVILVLLFILFTAGMGIMNFLCADREFSESENRVLQKRPDVNMATLADGSFMDSFETYLNDQFPLRDQAISLKSLLQLMTGKREQNGVYIGQQGFLFEQQSEFDFSDAEKKAAAIDRFCNENSTVEVVTAIVPNSSLIYKELLPYGVSLPDQQLQLQSLYGFMQAENNTRLDTVKTLSALKGQDSLLYYRTDHHWTTRGACGVFQELCRIWETQEAEYEFIAVTDSFEGTLASMAGVHRAYDTVEICVPGQSQGTYVVTNEELQKKSTTLFDAEKLDTKNKYEVFLGGNYGKVHIETVNANGRSLLLIKDSYANCLIPMLTAHFSEIIVVDPRYMTQSIEEVMSEYDITHALFLYNLNTFLEDTSLLKVLGDE